MKLISVIIPFFNEQDNLIKIYEELNSVTKDLAQYNFEILLMDNCSSDSSRAIALEIKSKDLRVKYFRQSRNFGYQINIMSGYLNCSGDAAIQLDADGEDDPQFIKKFVQEWEKGFDVVYGIRVKRAENFFLTLQRKLFYRLLRSLSELDIPADAGDFRLIDRKVLTALAGFKESTPYIRGLLTYSGFKQKGLSYERRPRYRGESKFSYVDYFSMAWDAVTSFSKRPLLLINWLGLSLCTVSFLLGLFYFGLYLLHQIPIQGFTTIIILFLFFSGVNLLCLGVMATYIGRIFDEVKRRPSQFFEEK